MKRETRNLSSLIMYARFFCPDCFLLSLENNPILLLLLLFSHQVLSNSFATPWTVARQAPLPVGFYRQEQWSGLPFPSPGDLPNPGIKPSSPALHSMVSRALLTTEPPGKPIYGIIFIYL